MPMTVFTCICLCFGVLSANALGLAACDSNDACEMPDITSDVSGLLQARMEKELISNQEAGLAGEARATAEGHSELQSNMTARAQVDISLHGGEAVAEEEDMNEIATNTRRRYNVVSVLGFSQQDALDFRVWLNDNYRNKNKYAYKDAQQHIKQEFPSYHWGVVESQHGFAYSMQWLPGIILETSNDNWELVAFAAPCSATSSCLLQTASSVKKQLYGWNGTSLLDDAVHDQSVGLTKTPQAAESIGTQSTQSPQEKEAKVGNKVAELFENEEHEEVPPFARQSRGQSEFQSNVITNSHVGISLHGGEAVTKEEKVDVIGRGRRRRYNVHSVLGFSQADALAFRKWVNDNYRSKNKYCQTDARKLYLETNFPDYKWGVFESAYGIAWKIPYVPGIFLTTSSDDWELVAVASPIN